MSEEINTPIAEEITENTEKIYREISGIYIFDEINGKKTPVCIEEASEETRNEWLNALEKEALISTCNKLCTVISSVAEQFGIIRKH